MSGVDLAQKYYVLSLCLDHNRCWQSSVGDSAFCCHGIVFRVRPIGYFESFSLVYF